MGIRQGGRTYSRVIDVVIIAWNEAFGLLEGGGNVAGNRRYFVATCG